MSRACLFLTSRTVSVDAPKGSCCSKQESHVKASMQLHCSSLASAFQTDKSLWCDTKGNTRLLRFPLQPGHRCIMVRSCSRGKLWREGWCPQTEALECMCVFKCAREVKWVSNQCVYVCDHEWRIWSLLYIPVKQKRKIAFYFQVYLNTCVGGKSKNTAMQTHCRYLCIYIK